MPTLTAGPDVRFRRAERVASRSFGDDTVLLQLETGHYFDLDAAGSRFWNLLASIPELRRVVDVLEAEFDAPREQIESDLLNLAAELEEEGLVVREP